MTVAEVLTSQHKAFVKAAKKISIREIEEVAPGSYTAFADEGNVSFDIQLAIDTSNNITQHFCDCGSIKPYCVHQVALISNLYSIKKEPQKKVKKLTQAEQLLLSLDTDKLKKWVGDVLIENREMAMAFVHHFTATEKQYSLGEIKLTIAEVVTAVVKKRSKVLPSEAKKIIQLWDKILMPLYNEVYGNFNSQPQREKLWTIYNEMFDYAKKLVGMEQLINNYLRTQLSKIHQLILEIDHRTLFEDILYELAHNSSDTKWLKRHYILFLLSIYNDFNEWQKSLWLRHVLPRLIKVVNDGHDSGLCKLLLEVCIKNNVVAEHIAPFKPSVFVSEYNLMLANEHMKLHQIKIAEKICQDAINQNHAQVDTTGFVEMLIDIYKHTKNEKYYSLLELSVYKTYRFDHFLEVYENMPAGKVRDSWATNCINRAKRAAMSWQHVQGASELPIRFYVYIGRVAKAIKSIDANTPVSLILEFFDMFYELHPIELISAISLINIPLSSATPYSHDHKEALFQKIIVTYDKHLLFAVLKNAENHYTNQFLFSKITAYLNND